MDFLSALDLNGVPAYKYISNNENLWRTKIGGVATLILNIVSLLYLIYVLIQWQSGEILPKTTQQIISRNSSQQVLEEDFLSIAYYKYSPLLKDPFDPNNIILMPLMFTTVDSSILGPINVISINCNQQQADSQKESVYSSYEATLPIGKLVSNQNLDQSLPPQELIFFVIIECNEKFLKENQKCASSSDIDAFNKLNLTSMSLKVSLKQYQGNELITVRKEYYIYLNNTQMYNSQLMVHKSTAKVNQGLLFDDISTNDYISNIEINSQIDPPNRYIDFIGLKTQMSMFIRLDPIETINQIAYPNLGEILAQVGSIVNLLMLTNYLIQLFNKLHLECYLLDEIIGIYYPQFKQLTIKRSLFGKIEQIKYQNHFQDSKTLQTFLEWYELVRKKAQKKLLFNNNLYEITRIQFLLICKILQKEDFVNSTRYGCRLEFLKSNTMYIEPEEIELVNEEYSMLLFPSLI